MSIYYALSLWETPQIDLIETIDLVERVYVEMVFVYLSANYKIVGRYTQRFCLHLHMQK